MSNLPLRWYLTSSAVYLLPGGIQMVLFPYLVVVLLHESPARVGFAQMAGQLPMVLLILVGGLIGDRVDQRRLLVRLHVVMMLPPIVMAALVGTPYFSYGLLIAWGLVGGVLGAFAQPARDALLNRVAGRNVQGVVMLATAIQFGVQVVGFALGSTADRVGPQALLLMQASFMAICAWATLRIPALAAAPARPQQPALREIGEGISIAWQSPVIRPAILLTCAVGVFFAGTFMVVLPLMVRDLYAGGAVEIAWVFGANMLGTVTTIMFLMRRGGVLRPGRALILGAAVSCCILTLLHWPLPLWAFYSVAFFWGMCGGLSMTMSRAIVQEAAPASHRARLMSVYSLGMMGGMPLGSLLLGWCVGEFGARDAIWVPVFGMATVVLLLAARTRLWSVERASNEAEMPLPAAAS